MYRGGRTLWELPVRWPWAWDHRSGTVLLLGNFGMLSVQPGEVFYTYWPLVPLLWGLVGTVETLAKRRQGLFFPLLIFVASGILLGNKLNWWDVSFSQFVDFLWPVMLILLGWFLFREGTRWRGKGRFSFWNNLELDKESELTSDQFIAFMGGIDLDLTKVSLPAETVTLHLTAVMGGIDVILPPDLDVVCQGNVFLGGVEFSARKRAACLPPVLCKGRRSPAAACLGLQCDSGGSTLGRKAPGTALVPEEDVSTDCGGDWMLLYPSVPGFPGL